jgi:hypothetical protein
MKLSTRDTPSLAGQCRQIIEELDRATRLHPREIETVVDEIQRDIVRLRDSLIEQLRQAQSSPHSSRRHPGLDAINAALSLVVAVEYPVTAIQRSLLEQARDKLKKILAEGDLFITPTQSPE